MKSRFLAVCYSGGFLVVTAAFPLLGADYSGTAGFSFLNLPVGARATAMGQAFGSVPNDVQGIVYNPACLASMAASQLSVQHLNYVESVTQESIAYGRAGRQEDLSWGVSVNYLRVGDISRTVVSAGGSGDGYTEAGSFTAYDLAVGVTGAAYLTENIRAGTTVKLIRESLSDASSSAGAVDAGFLYRLNDEHSWNVGVAATNLGFATRFADASVKLPTALRAGISGQPFAQWLFSTDYVKRVDHKGEFDAGIEVTPRRFVSLRLGYRYALTRPDLGGLSDFSAGIGFRHKRMSFDYAFIPLGDLGLTHHLSVNLRFKPKPDS